MINSIESERLERLIKTKVDRIKKLKETDPENTAIPYLNSEITFLRDSILPIILQDTTIEYSEIRDFLTKTFRQVENVKNFNKFTDLIVHIHLHEPQPGDGYVAAYKSTMELNQFIPADLYINYEKAIIYPLS